MGESKSKFIGEIEKKLKNYQGAEMKRKNVLYLGMLLMLLMLPSLGCERNAFDNKETEASENTKADESNSEQEQEEEKGVQFPIVLEDGKLEIESLFQFEGINPDANNATGTETAAIAVKNVSDKYLDEAEITVLTDEGELMFFVTNLPMGSTAMAFSTDNEALSGSAVCHEIKCDVTFQDDVIGIPEQISIQEDGMEINVTNTSEQSLSKVTIYCRCPFEEKYFGGAAYQYELQDLTAGETKVIHAEDSILGIVEVVRVEIE